MVFGGGSGRRVRLFHSSMGLEAFFGSRVLTGLRSKRTSFCKQPKVLQWFFGSIGFQSEDFQL